MNRSVYVHEQIAIESQGIAGDVIWHEDVRSLPGRLPAYHEALASTFVPLAE